MQHLLEIADKIPWVMAPAMVIAATIIISMLVVLIRLLESASKLMIVAMTLAMSGWALMMRTF
jgi:ABC-type cobalamin transport system permease subunit